jgi:hypothetical protein
MRVNDDLYYVSISSGIGQCFQDYNLNCVTKNTMKTETKFILSLFSTHSETSHWSTQGMPS